MRQRPTRAGPVAVILFALLVAVAVAALIVGSPPLSPGEVLDALRQENESLERVILTDLRLPRLALGVLAGAALALAGTLLQDGLRNPLAGPELLGVSSGAVVVVAALTVFDVPVPLLLYPWLALAGGVAAGTVVLAVLTRSKVGSAAVLILVGVAVSALLGAVVTAVIAVGDPNDLHLIYAFLLGSLAGTTWIEVRLVLPWVVIGIPAALVSGRILNLLQLGDEVAEGRGLHVVRARGGTLALSAALVAAVVSVSGAIGFVALLAPHLARRLLATSDSRRVLPAAALLGAILLVASDIAARHLLFPREVPVGVWTGMVGGPVLLLMLRRQLRAGLR